MVAFRLLILSTQAKKVNAALLLPAQPARANFGNIAKRKRGIGHRATVQFSTAEKGNVMITDTLRHHNGSARRRSPLAALTAIVLLALTLLLPNPSTAMAGKKSPAPSSKPPTPTNFRVTARTAYTVTVAWESAASSADYQYHLSGAYHVPPAVLPKTARSHTFTHLHPGNEYWFFIYAKNAAGDVSGQAQTTTRTLLDTTPPSTGPVVTVGEVGSNYVAISWTPPQDDGPHFFYEIWVNGALHAATGKNVISTVVRFLQTATAYSITVRGRDYGNFWSPFSHPVSINTAPTNPNDHTPPTIPANLAAYSFGDGSTEMEISWTQSSDDFDRAENIRYDVYVNGIYQETRFGNGGPVIAYGEFGDNTVKVIASDTAGNSAEPATTAISF